MHTYVYTYIYMHTYVRMYAPFSGSLGAFYLSSPLPLHHLELFSSLSYTDQSFQLALQPPVSFLQFLPLLSLQPKYVRTCQYSLNELQRYVRLNTFTGSHGPSSIARKKSNV